MSAQISRWQSRLVIGLVAMCVAPPRASFGSRTGAGDAIERACVAFSSVLSL